MTLKKFIRYFKEQDWVLFKRFVKRYFHDKYILLNRDFFNWQYTPPAARAKTPRVLVLHTGKSFLGYLGTIPVTMNYFGKYVRAVCLANIMTDDSLRGKGAGAAFVARAMEEGDIIYVVGYNAPMRRLFPQFGWREGVLLRRFVKVFDAERVKKLIGRQDVSFDIPQEEREPGEPGGSLEFREIQKFGKDADEFWKRIKAKYPITAKRSSAYLNWRYANHPIFNYRILCAARDGVTEAFIVFRTEEAGKYRACRVVDFLSTDDAEAPTLIRFSALCRKENVCLADFFFTGRFHERGLERVGFIETNKKPYSLIPSRFSPIDRNPNIIVNFTSVCMNEKICDKRFNDVNNWYVTTGDGDKDRPNPY